MSRRAAEEDTDGSDDDSPWYEGLQSCRAKAIAVWERIDSQAELLLAIVKQLDTAEDLARAGGVCRVWRQIARDDALWEDVCSRSSIPLLALLKLRPGCTLSWRQIFVQNRMAARVAEQLVLVEPPAPLRSDYMIAVECRCSMVVVHASLNELSERDDEHPLYGWEHELLHLRGLTSAGFSGSYERGEPTTRVSLLRKSDSKLMQLAIHSGVEEEDNDHYESGSALILNASDTRMGLYDQFEDSTAIYMTAIWHVERTPRDRRSTRDQQFLTGLEFECYLDGEPVKVEDMLRVAERPEYANRWV
jgi:hypothetical protein